MAHLWSIGGGGSWAPAALDEVAFVLGAVPALSAVVLRLADGGPDASWALLIPAAVPVLVNGASSPLGLVVLADRDEIRVPGSPPVFFSTETLAAIVPLPADAPRGFCPRCKQAIDAGTPAVRCPDCSLWYHQSDVLPCWTYGDRCAACARPTPLDADFSWTPEEV